jgi:hypothetical protein
MMYWEKDYLLEWELNSNSLFPVSDFQLREELKNSGVLSKTLADVLVINPPRLQKMKSKDAFGFGKVEAAEIEMPRAHLEGELVIMRERKWS